MKYSELPKAYKELADKYKPFWGQSGGRVAFDFGNTDEGRTFWEQCSRAKNESELPPLPKDQRIEQLEKRIEELESKLSEGDRKPFEVGDYVVILELDNCQYGSVGQIKRINNGDVWPNYVKTISAGSYDWFSNRNLRHATEEEIEQATRNTVGGYEVSEGDEYNEFTDGGIRWGKKTKIGCEQFRPSFIDRLKRLLDKQDVRIILEGEDVTDDIIRL